MKQINLGSINQYYINHKKRIEFTLEFSLVVVIALIAWLLENRIFSLFILSFFFLVKVFQHKQFFVLVITPLILFIIFNTQVLGSLLLLTRTNLPSIQHPKAVIITLFTPASGLEVLPPQVLSMISIMNENDVNNYRLSENILSDMYIYQRIIEGAWPIRPNQDSSFVLITPEEIENYNNCSVIDEKEDVILVNCD